MKKDTIKRTVLLGLLAVCIYIWWGNLELFQEQESYFDRGISGIEKQPIKSPASELEFKEPRINPFKRPETASTAEKPTQQKPPTPQQPQKISASYLLVGILRRGDASQAVLRTGGNQSQVIAITDTIAGWELTAMGNVFVVFRQDKWHDTLWLQAGSH